jgi:hypothetical protein
MMKRILHLLIVLLYYSTAASANEASAVSMELKLSPETISVNEKTFITFSVTHPAKYSLEQDDLLTSLLFMNGRNESRLFSIGKTSLTSTSSGEQALSIFSCELEAWVEGIYPITFQKIKLTSPKAPAIIVVSDVISLTVTPPLASERESLIPGKLLSLTAPPALQVDKALKSELENRQKEKNGEASRNLQLFNKRSFPWLVLLLSVSLCLFLWIFRRPLSRVYQYLLRKKLQHKDPRHKALHALEALSLENLSSNGLFHDFYVKLTQIVRIFLEEQYKLKAPEQTSEEFLLEIQKSETFSELTNQKLEDFLFHADLVKFARLHPDASDGENALESAKTFVRDSS